MNAQNAIRWNGKPVFQMERADSDAIKNRLGNFRVAPVTVLVQLKLKRHFSWIDALYISFVGRLAAKGFRPVVLIHDYDYGLSTDSAIGKALTSNEYHVDLQKKYTGHRSN